MEGLTIGVIALGVLVVVWVVLIVVALLKGAS
jgi:hypothetical protein